MINANQKGKRGEREVAKIINNKFDSNVRRTPNSGGLSIKGDIIDINPLSPLFRYHFEIKNQNRLAIPKWWEQATGDCPRGKDAVLVYKMNHRWLCTVELDDLLNLIKENEDLREGLCSDTLE